MIMKSWSQLSLPASFSAGYLHNEIVKQLDQILDPDPYHYLASLGLPVPILERIKKMDESQVLVSLPLSSRQKEYVCTAFKQLEKDEINLDFLWEQVLKDPLLSAPERNLLFQLFGLLQMSFWHWKNVFRSASKVPLGEIVKADGVGFLKGLLLGLLFFALYDLKRTYSTVGIVGGSAIVLLFSAGESYLFAKKYKKNPHPYDFYE